MCICAMCIHELFLLVVIQQRKTVFHLHKSNEANNECDINQIEYQLMLGSEPVSINCEFK